jgi:hypothetical protein
MREPGPHQGIIPFPGIDRWRLRTPSQRLQPAGQVVRMVMHTARHQHHRTDAQERPSIGVKAGLEGPRFEDRQHPLPRRRPQASRAARDGVGVQARQVALVLSQLASPCADGHPTDAESAGDGGVGQLTSLEQPSSFQAAFFPWRAGEVCWAPDHGRLLSTTLGETQ